MSKKSNINKTKNLNETKKLKEIKAFIETQTKEYRKLYIQYNLAEWNAQTKGKKQDFEKVNVVKQKINLFLNNKKKYETLKEYSSQKTGSPLLDRQIIVLKNEFLSKQGRLSLLNKISKIETQATLIFNNYRAEIKGKKVTDNDLKNILKSSINNQELKEAWEANKKQGLLVEKKLIKLVKLRNELAKSLGYKNFYELGLAEQEQDIKSINKIVQDLKEKGELAWKKTKKEIDIALIKKLNVKKLKPWHYQDFFFQDPISVEPLNLDKYYEKDVLQIGIDFFKEIGLDVSEIVKKSDMYERKGKCQHAFAMDLDREGDVRTLNNLKNNEKWLSTLLHELGHCVYWKYMNEEIPYLLRETAHTFITEAVAMFFGRLTHNPDFLEYLGYRASNKEKKKILKNQKTAMQISTRWMMVMIEFEQALYKDPDQDLNKKWWALVKKYQHINYTRNKPDWASKIHFTIAPVYYHNYLLGEVLASQIASTITKKTKIINKETGKKLKMKIFDQGKTRHWNETIIKALGQKLKTKYFEKEFY